MHNNLTGFWHSGFESVSYPKYIIPLGYFLLALYATCLVPFPGIGSPAETLMAIMGLGSLLVWGKSLRKSAALWLLLSIIIVQVLSWSLGYLHHPQWVEDNPQVDRLAKLFIFISVAWWLGGSTARTLVIWCLALTAYFVALFIHGDGVSEWLQGVSGERVDFGIRNAQHTAMFFGAALLGLLAFSQRCLFPKNYTFLLRGFWAVSLFICISGVIITQTRAVWLGLVMSLPVMLGLFYWWYLKHHSGKNVRRFFWISACSIALIGTATSYLWHDTVINRLGNERAAIEAILVGDFSQVPYTSVGIRVHTWRAAAEWITERPLVGWGGQGRSLVTDHTEWLPQKIKDKYGHLHNFFLELWVAYGLLGVAVISALAFWVARATWLAWRGGAMPSDMALFGVTFFVYWVIINQFESYNSFWTGVYVHNIVLGGLVTHYWRWQLAGARDDNTQTESTSQPK